MDTTLDGAKKFLEKIAEFLFEKFESNSKEIYLRLLSTVKFLTHPLNQFSGSTDSEVKPIILENHIIKNKKKKKSGISSINLYDDLKQYSKPLMSETIVLPLSLFQQELLTDTNPIDYKYLKRFTDIVGSTIGIILFSLVIVIIAILIKLTSKGPILFRQKRLGYLGNEFSFLKFRTMSDDSDDNIHKEYVEKLINGQNDVINKGTEDEPLYKLDNDPRITWIGNYLRKFSLDELPQFFNVIKGDMSLVGPRPPIPYEVDNYQYWHLRRILEVKPGITGLWQVNGRSKTTFNEMVRLDIQYINNQSFLLDTKIIFKTFAAVFNTDGAL